MKKTFIITLFSIFLSVFLFGCKVKTPSVEITLTSELNSVSYSLKFNDIEEDRNYKVTLSVAEKQVAEKVNTVKNNTGKFDNLEYNREYFLEVYIGEKANSKEYTTKLGESKISTNVLKFENVKLEGQTFTYDGTAKSISVTGAPEGTNIEYTGNGVTEVGEHTVSAKLTKEGYEDLTLTAKIVIVKSTVDFTIENVETVYSGQPVSVEVETELELTYEYYLGETKLESAPVNAGTYTVKAIYAGNAGVEGLTKSATLTIKKADTTITAANVTKVYDGTAAAVTATLSNGATPVVKYYNGTTELTEAPVAVGEYTAKVTYAGNENYNAAADVTVTITITKAAAAELTIANKEVTYNGEAQTITATTSLTVTYEYYNGTTKLDAAPVNAGTYTVKAIYAGDANHEAKTVEATLTIKKADVTITAANVTKVYDGTAATVTATLSNGATAAIAYQSDAAPVNAGTYTATVSYAGNENYNAAESVTVTITISKATVEFELADIETTYGQTYEVEADTELTVTYEYYNGTTKLDAAPVNAGTYTVKAIYAGDANHEGLTVEAELVIAKADTSITAPANVSKEYDEEPAVVIATVSNGGTPVIKYYKDNTELTEAPVEIGVYKAVISYVGNENYNAAESVTVTINITKPGYVALEITVDPITVTYGETYEVEGTVTGHNEVSFEDLTIEYYLGETKLDAKPVDAGTYTIIVSYEVNDDLFIAAAKVEVALVINQVEVELSLEDKEVTYNGNAHTLEAETELTVTYEYYLGTEKVEEAVNAGTYTVKAIYAGDVNHAAKTVEAELVIKQASTTITVEETEIEINVGETYEIEATVSNDDNETIVIKYYNGTTELTAAPTEAGEYTAVVSYAGNVNYSAATDVKVTITIIDPDKEAVEAALKSLTITNTTVKEDFNLPTLINAEGLTVEWESNNAAIVIENGVAKVTRPAAYSSDATVTLTVTITSGEYSDEKTFTIKVPANFPTTEYDIITYEKAEDLAGVTQGKYTDEKYYLAGIVKEIKQPASGKSNYGNMYIEDENGNIFYIYGTWTYDGSKKYEDMEAATKPQVNDFVVLYGILGYYSEPQMNTGWLVQLNEKDILSEAKVAADKAEILVEREIIDEINLETEGSNGSAITWVVKSGSAIVIENAIATVTQPEEGEGSATVVLTATITLNGIVDTVDVTVIVAEKTNPDKTAIKKDQEALSNLIPESTKVDLDLYTEGVNGTQIVWSSNKENVISTTGKVVRPAAYSKNETVTLTAVLTKGSERVELTFEVEVIANFPTTEYKDLTFEEATTKAKAAGTSYTTDKFYIAGIVDRIANAQYGNIYIKDEAGNEFYVYGVYLLDSTRYDSMSADIKPVVGDYIVVYGKLGTYSGSAQMKDSTLVQLKQSDLLATYNVSSDLNAIKDFSVTTEISLKDKGTNGSSIEWTLVNEEDAQYINNVDGSWVVVEQPETDNVEIKFTVTVKFNNTEDEKEITVTIISVANEQEQPQAPVEVTKELIIGDYADANNWENSKKYTNAIVDENVEVNVTGSSNSGKYYTNGENWRLYQNENATITISSSNKQIVSVVVQYTISDNGSFKLNGNTVSSGTKVSVNANSVTFNIGSTSGTKGKIFISKITVTYLN